MQIAFRVAKSSRGAAIPDAHPPLAGRTFQQGHRAARQRGLATVLGALVVLVGGSALAAPLEVIPVPQVPTDLSVPHFAYNGHPTTFKAIARGGSSNSYVFQWDFEGDGTFETSTSTANRYNLAASSTYPNQAVDRTFVARIRVTNGGETVEGTYPVRVFADVPGDPALADARQLQVMRAVAVDDGLWYLHNQMTRTGNEADPVHGAQASGDFGSLQVPANSFFVESLARSSHLLAFPPAYSGVMPDPTGNAHRWAHDPYAEDAMRLINSLLWRPASVAVEAVDESNLTGFDPEVTASGIAGTDDLMALLAVGSYGLRDSAHVLRALAVTQRGGFIAQLGNISDPNGPIGRTLAHAAQQLVDGLAFAQNESGVVGAWGYAANDGWDILSDAVAAGSIEILEALWVAERWMGAEGVIVPNRVKARALAYIRANANACPGVVGGSGGSFTSAGQGVCDFGGTAAHALALGWVGANAMEATDTLPAFPGYNALTRGELRQQYDATVAFVTGTGAFPSGSQSTTYGYDTRFVAYVSSSDPAVAFGQADGRGNLYAMLRWSRAAQAAVPTLQSFGSFDHARFFGLWVVKNQVANGSWKFDYYSDQLTDNNLGSNGRAGEAVLLLLPDDPIPVAAISLPPAIQEGAPFTLTGSGSIADAVTFEWDVGAGNFASGPSIDFAIPDDKTFDVTFTTTTAQGVSSTQTLSIVVANVAPLPVAGPDVAVAEGDLVPFAGAVSDPGTDTHTFAWAFGDGQEATTLSTAHTYVDDGDYVASLTATDDDGGVGVDSATVTVVNVAPTITSTPAASAKSGTPYVYALTYTDPGAADTHTCSVVLAPATATRVGCTVSWTPAQEDFGSTQAFKVCVADDDGGEACEAFDVTVTESATLLQVTDSQVGILCDGFAQGGRRMRSGYDDGLPSGTAHNGLLEDGEVQTTAYACIAADGKPGSDGLSTLFVMDAQIGTACDAFGGSGTRLRSGLDDGLPSGTAGDRILQDGEVDATVTTCNGAPGGAGADGASGFQSLVVIDAEVGAQCGAFGGTGQRVSSGVDDGEGGAGAADGLLAPSEIDTTRYVCDGADGHDVIVASDAAVEGGPCAAGGTRLRMGTDDGTPSGVAGDHVLQDGEVDTTTWVCNGAAGAAGPAGDPGHGYVFAIDGLVGDACGPEGRGGLRVRSGVDDGLPGGIADNGVLEDEEAMGDPQVICNGVPEAPHSALIAFEEAGAGACPGAGVVVVSAVDSNGNGAIDPDERDLGTSQVLCDGVRGADGADGADAGCAGAAGGGSGAAVLLTLLALCVHGCASADQLRGRSVPRRRRVHLRS